MKTCPDCADERDQLVRLMFSLEVAIHDVKVAAKALRQASQMEMEPGEFVRFVTDALDGIHARLECNWEKVFAIVRRDGEP